MKVVGLALLIASLKHFSYCGSISSTHYASYAANEHLLGGFGCDGGTPTSLLSAPVCWVLYTAARATKGLRLRRLKALFLSRRQLFLCSDGSG